jgi:hypothetical protein
MSRAICIAVVLVAVAPVTRALGHGHPIVVTQADNRLVVSGGVAGAANGFVNQIYVETDSAGDPQDYFEPADFGPAVYWIVPGFELSGLAENSGLYLQTLSRPVQGTNPVESRVFWFWNPTSSAQDKVEIAPGGSRMQIRHSATVNTLVTPTTFVAPPPIKIADPLAGDMGYHNHDLVKYLLPYPLPDDGAYAFFARLTSDLYGPSDPFLVVINNGGLAGSDMLDAAATINRDALLAGDYNHDDLVDAKDYIVWRKTLGSITALAADGSRDLQINQADCDVWRRNFGLALGNGGGVAVNSVPEPHGVVLLATGLSGCFFLLTIWRRFWVGASSWRSRP